ncbi:Exostoses (Multiple)-like 3 [Apophysomyces sp. BC1034]|nr:Exostoses (Multiple)-like 3 [Apophysomyces sp. BC1021]KAG0188154.1 Exostoses (Multiple)-like 3 [Apophysomyces sp. BC1034]
MQRRFYILALAVVFSLLALLSLHPALRVEPMFRRTSQPDQQWDQTSISSRKRAFATMVCDPELLDASMVSIYSLKSTLTEESVDILILLPETVPVSNKSVRQLEMLGTVIRTPTLQHSTTTCDSYIHLWTLSSYEKIIYFTADVSFTQDADPLFGIPAHSAIIQQSSGSWPLMVLEPSVATFKFLASDFKQHKDLTFHEFLTRSSLAWQVTNLPEGVFLFSGPLKPWAFHYYNDNDWLKYYDPIVFYRWRRTHQEVKGYLNQENEWPNQARQRAVCDSYDPIETYPVQDQFSVLVSTYTPERIEHLASLITYLLRSPKVHTVYVTWHNPKLEVPDSILVDDRVQVLTQEYDSLNNRFNPIPGLVTEAVYILDDDVFVDLDDLAFTFQAWQTRKDSVVGHFPRIHTYNTLTHNATYKVCRPESPYSIILTKSMFIRSEYLFAYTCVLDPALHRTIDDRLNCEDIAFSMMATGLSGARAVHVRPSKPLLDFGLRRGISTNTHHMGARSECVADFINQFWNAKDPLKTSFDGVSPFTVPQVIGGTWSRLEKQIAQYS